MQPRHLRLKCVRRQRETPNVITFAFCTTDGQPLKHLPGQALALALPLPEGTAWRTFTIASPPTRAEGLELTVKAAPDGHATRWMHEALHPGTEIEARGPVGRFSIAHHYAPAFALISGGSGVTPMMSMLRWLADREERVDVAFIHAARTPADVLFAGELAELDRRMPNLRIGIVVSDVPLGQSWAGYRGRIDRRMLALMLPDLARREVLCCGPAAFMGTIGRIYHAEGGDPLHFHTESFGPAKEPDAPAPAVVSAASPASTSGSQIIGTPLTGGATLTIDGRTIPATAGMTVLAAARAGGVVIPTGCQEGMCGTCRVRRLEGKVEMAHKGGITAREERRGYILACCSRLAGDVKVATRQ
jgi:ferredoxin-NADP reductase